MFSENDLVERSVEDMAREVSELQAESERMQKEHDSALQRVLELRRESVEIRPEDPELAESLWQEAELLQDKARENLRLSMEKKLRAAEVQHRIDIHDQIESINDYDEVWSKAAGAGRG
jgi:Mg2+ and Co2+ transporter CorA